MDPWIRSFDTLTETQDEVVVRTGFVETMHRLSTRGANPITEVASAHGAGVAPGNGVIIFSDTGAFLATAICCLGLHARHRTLGETIAAAHVILVGAVLALTYGNHLGEFG